MIGRKRAAGPAASRPPGGTLSIALMDYSGHPCQVQLSRELARRGHRVRHLHCPDYASGKGNLTLRDGDPSGLTIEAVSLNRAFERYRIVQRLIYELLFGIQAARVLGRLDVDVIVLSNVPLIAHAIIVARLARRVPLVFWQQDVYSHALTEDLERRWGKTGVRLGRIADWLEAAIARHSRYTVAITEAFRPTLNRWRVPDSRIEIVPNWAPLDEMPQRPRRNEWSVRHGLDDRFVAMYSGTLGLKHDPARLTELARLMRQEHPRSLLVVVSQGAGRDWLEDQITELGLADQLLLLDYQDYADLPMMLASAEFFVTLLEPEAGVFSVPSKTLNYLCAARPTLGIMPKANLAAAILTENAAGVVLEEPDAAELGSAVRELVGDADLRQRLGANARAYAERTFQVGAIVDTFERVLRASLTSGR